MESNKNDSKTGFNSVTKTFHSLRPSLNLPPYSTSLSSATYAFSLRSNSPPSTPALIDASTGQHISYTEFTHRVSSLAFHLQSTFKLSKGDVALIVTPNSIRVPILYFALLSINVVASPINPISTDFEISRLIKISKPVIAFATSATLCKVVKLNLPTVLIDSPEFHQPATMLTCQKLIDSVEVTQDDVAAILYSSGTTGKLKGVMTTHGNLISIVSGYEWAKQARENPVVHLYTVPYFHIFGFFYCLKSVALNETVVVMERFDLKKMLKAVEEFGVTHVAVAPPVVVAMLKSEVTDGYDLSSLEQVGCGGAPLGKDVIAAFTIKFPGVQLLQGYGLTETTGAVSRPQGPQEILRWGSVGRLQGGFEAKVIDLESGQALPPGKQGELWLRGPAIMKGYLRDPESTSTTIVAGGWLRTGDICYIDDEGFLYIVDRLKELIKYKGYQVAPAELEQVLQSHPEIHDAAVIPYPDEEAGQIPMACVVRHPQSSLDETEIMNFVAKQVAPYKKIRRVAFVSSIPKSAAGKILRRELKEIFISGSSSKL
ncbi:hypothetical protein ACFE04_007579 [Oxalis oulophora]